MVHNCKEFFMRVSIALGFIALLSVDAGAGTTVASLNQADIRSRLIGHSYYGTEDGVAYTEKLLSDGTVLGTDKTGAYGGSWTIRSPDTICLRIEDDTSPDCSRVIIDGNRIKWISSDGAVTYSTFASN